jgi:hypothetical protein
VPLQFEFAPNASLRYVMHTPLQLSGTNASERLETPDAKHMLDPEPLSWLRRPLVWQANGRGNTGA